MLENVVVFGVMVGSCALFAYWLRFVCLLIVTAKPAERHARKTAVEYGLRFGEIDKVLKRATPRDLTRLHAALNRDFLLLGRLLDRAETRFAPVAEAIILSVNYWTMSAWCWATSLFAPRIARWSLKEMAIVVEYLAGTLGERTARSCCLTAAPFPRLLQ